MPYLESGTLEEKPFMNDKGKSYINGVFLVHLYKVCFQMGKNVKKTTKKFKMAFREQIMQRT
jgi:hypothetical protein